MPSPQTRTNGSRRPHLAVKLVFRLAVALVLVLHLTLASLRSEAGPFILEQLVRLHLVQPSQVGDLLGLIQPPGAHAVPSLAREIHKATPPDAPLVLVWFSKPIVTASVELEYLLYPRLLAQRAAGQAPVGAHECDIEWRSANDLTLRCPASTVHYFGEDRWR